MKMKEFNGGEEDLTVLQIVNSNKSYFQKQLDALERAGVSYTAYQVPDSRYNSQGDLVPRGVKQYLKFLKNLRAEDFDKYDLIHSNHGLMSGFNHLFPDLPSVATFWGSDLMDDRFSTKLYSYSASHCDTVILPSEEMFEYANFDYEYVPFGVDTDLFRPIPKKDARKLIGWCPESYYVLFPYPKSRTEKNYKLADDICSSLSISVNLEVVSGVDYEYMPIYMNAADAVLVTSHRESGPMVVKEATLCNTPVVSTDVGFVDDVLSDVENSHVSDDRESLITELSLTLKDGGISDGRKHVDSWSIDSMGERLVDIYDKIIQ